MRVALCDYGTGNLHSLRKALQAHGACVRIDDDPARLLKADALVLPGVGAFGAAAARFAPGRVAIVSALEAGFPCLGICLGMQLLFDRSEESPGEGLGFIPGRVRRLRAERVPQMGWNTVEPAAGAPSNEPPQGQGPSGQALGTGASDTGGIAATSAGDAGNGEDDDDRASAQIVPDPIFTASTAPTVYYANTYVGEPDDDRDVIAWTTYGRDRFAAAVRRRRTWGVQFHPEKSSSEGLQILGNWLAEAAR
jgi:glutamine amidotransferase